MLAALEETQQQLHRTQITSSVHEGNSDAYFAECERLRGGLAEAQQTIARHEEALNGIIAYSTDENAVNIASESMGYVEGDQP